MKKNRNGELDSPGESEPMEHINRSLETIAQKIMPQIQRADLYETDCRRCFGTGTILTERGAKWCRCAQRRSNRMRLAQIPPIFGNPKLSRLRAQPERHAKQSMVIARMKAHPTGSYLFTGHNGSGKSHFAYALLRYAIATGKGTVKCSVSELLDDFRKLAIADDDEDVRTPRITVDMLTRRPGEWFILLEEFEKARPTEFAAEMLFRVLDAVWSYNHQLVVTSNMNEEGIRRHWSRVEQIWGNSIVERLQGCYVVEMF